DEIQILSLVGATRTFIRAPFLLEGAFWGLGGGLLAVVVLFVADRVLAPQLSAAVASVLGGLQISLFSPAIGAAVLGAGLVLGVLGSSLAVSRFLVDEEQT
ncbi:MAG: FtsX-like permease family protein, partial [Myxococcota bacterium]